MSYETPSSSTEGLRFAIGDYYLHRGTSASLSPNHLNCEDCSAAAYCEQNICICRAGYEGDGYECNSLCELDEVWSTAGCAAADRQTTTPQQDVVPEDESEEFGKRFGLFLD